MKTIDDLVSGELDTMDPEWWSDPYRHLADARDRGWLFRSPRGFEVVRYQQMFTLLRNRNMSQEHVRMAHRAGITHPEVLRFRTNFLINTLGTDHIRIRTSVGAYFGHENVAALQSAIRGIVEDIFDEVDDPHNVEMVRGVCEQIPARTFLYMIGHDTRDVEMANFIAQASDSILKIFREDVTLKDEVEQTYLKVFELVQRIIDERRASSAEPQGDLVDHVLSAQDRDTITGQEAFDLIVLALEASVDNTYTQMVLTLSALLENPDQWNQLKQANDEALTRQAIEEGIRFRPRVIGQRRTAYSPFEFADVHVPEGSDFYLSVLSAHRDPEAFENPDVFDIHRTMTRPTVMFGGGMTACMGSGLARLEMQEFFGVLMDRYPNVALTRPWSYEFVGRTVCVPGEMWVNLDG
ncbi:cytochrome P450 [Nocardioides sp. AE5]|uniref:cytochrome P450 n=1 Tax=Nocardioides sp. AE5 TaxID=2962573 RepID=UPI002881EFB3|nr:cytochrome P450 [Nocardioides sp. AE5]MDT0200469.1 cytochrome P450 [Nocardioides sp. AE5]